MAALLHTFGRPMLARDVLRTCGGLYNGCFMDVSSMSNGCLVDVSRQITKPMFNHATLMQGLIEFDRLTIRNGHIHQQIRRIEGGLGAHWIPLEHCDLTSKITHGSCWLIHRSFLWWAQSTSLPCPKSRAELCGTSNGRDDPNGTVVSFNMS